MGIVRLGSGEQKEQRKAPPGPWPAGRQTFLTLSSKQREQPLSDQIPPPPKHRDQRVTDPFINYTSAVESQLCFVQNTAFHYTACVLFKTPTTLMFISQLPVHGLPGACSRVTRCLFMSYSSTFLHITCKMDRSAKRSLNH